MVHLASFSSTSVSGKPFISAFSWQKALPPSSPKFHRIWASSNASSDQDKRCIQRRNVGLGLVTMVLGLSADGGNAVAAGRRPPPQPPAEKKDPNVSGVLAKVLASKKRKEALKEATAKLREKGKIIQEPSK